ncbi:MAG TPA: PIN domain-containing protein [Verrucomicrobiae bacterium]|nr:PIN domain-containing protein [Verrucomicrobiae bacterium]
MKVTLDTCVLKLATLPNPVNKSAVIVELCLRGAVRPYITPDMLAEYQRVLSDSPLLLEQVQSRFHLCLPLFSATAIAHEPDNRILECALAAQADYVITVNTARGHFDRKSYGDVKVATPGEFLALSSVKALLRRLAD